MRKRLCLRGLLEKNVAGVMQMNGLSGFTGMMITLKKRMTCMERDDTEQYHYMIFGHYDGMDIHCVDQWYQLRPKGVEENINISDDFLDKYTLKLYMPNPNIRENLEKQGFAYHLWKKIGYHSSECREIFKRYPFISVAVANLSKRYVQNNNEMLENITKSIKEAAEKRAIALDEIHCAVMPSIGYEDFALLFLSDNPQKVISILDILRGKQMKGQDNRYPMLANSYVISGFAKEGLERLDKLSLYNVKLSIRINLKEGVSAVQFQRDFDVKIMEESGVKTQDFDKNKTKLYQMFGNSDCLILSDMPFDYFIPLFYDGRLLNPGNELFKKYIRNIRSSICVEVDTEALEQEVSEDVRKISQEYQELFKELIEMLKRVVENYQKPMRSVNSLQIIMKLFLNLVKESHCFDVERIIGKAFRVLKDNVEKTIFKIDSLGREKDKLSYLSDEGIEAAKAEIIDNLLSAVKIFCERVGSYLADMQRSDRSFIEGQSLSHPSIGSATKLLFFYNQYINDMARKLVRTEKESKESYTFIVMSGKCDVTNAIDVFSYLDPAENDGQWLIIIDISERSLYDVKGTMFRLLHECLHYCGERKRRERYAYLVKSFSSYSAWALCRLMQNSLWGHVDERILYSLQYHMPSGDWEDIRDQSYETVRQYLKNTQIELAEEMRQRIQKSRDVEDYELYGRYLSFAIKDVIDEEEIFQFNRKETSYFAYTYQKYMECQIKVAEDIKYFLKKKNMFFSGANILKKTAEDKLAELQDGKYDPEEEQVLQVIFEVYMGNQILDKEKASLDPIDATTAFYTLENLRDAMRELYADCMAAIILKFSVEDFILGFICETWDIETAFPRTVLETLRLGSEMKKLYGVEKKLTENERKKIGEKMHYWIERGFQYCRTEEYVERLCDRLDEILYEYASEYNEGCRTAVESYFDDCRKLFQTVEFEEAQKISGLSDMQSADELYRLLEEINKFWRQLAFEKKEL